MPNSTLTDARVKAFRPRKTVRDIRDGALRGFGVRVLSSGRCRPAANGSSSIASIAGSVSGRSSEMPTP